MLCNKGFVLLALTALSMSLLSCSDPVSPGAGLHIADYFPLEEGYSREYSYFYENAPGHTFPWIEGRCKYTVTSITNCLSYTCAFLEVAFNITESNLNYFSDTSFTRTFGILQQPDSIWYVADPPQSLDLLPQAERKLMMATPVNDSCYLDLQIFHVDLGDEYHIGRFKNRGELLFERIHHRLAGATLEYGINTLDYNAHNERQGLYTSVELTKGLGLRSIDYWDVELIQTTYSEWVKIKMEPL